MSEPEQNPPTRTDLLVVSPQVHEAYLKAISPWGTFKFKLRLFFIRIRVKLFGPYKMPPPEHCWVWYEDPYAEEGNLGEETGCGSCEVCDRKGLSQR